MSIRDAALFNNVLQIAKMRFVVDQNAGHNSTTKSQNAICSKVDENLYVKTKSYRFQRVSQPSY